MSVDTCNVRLAVRMIEGSLVVLQFGRPEGAIGPEILGALYNRAIGWISSSMLDSGEWETAILAIGEIMLSDCYEWDGTLEAAFLHAARIYRARRFDPTIAYALRRVAHSA